MIKAKKVRLYPTKEQIQQLHKSFGIARWVYNWCLVKQINHFESTDKLNKIFDGVFRKELTQLKKLPEFKWLNEVSSQIPKQAIKDCCKAIDRFHKESKKHGYKYRLSAIKSSKKSGKKLTFRDFEDFPRFKSKKKSKISFYNDNVALLIRKKSVLLQNVGWVRIKENLPIRLKEKSKSIYTNPRISFDGKYFYISIGYEQNNKNVDRKQNKLKRDLSIGIDLGIKDLAICSNGMKFKNINKTKKIKKLKKRLKRKQKQVSGKYEMNKQNNKFVKTNNIIKLEKDIKLMYRKLSNIRLNHIHQATNMIVKAKPHKVVMETLNIQGMMKNKHLAKAIQEQKLYEFKRQMQYKCKFNGIEFVEADKWYPSSKTCSKCGYVKKVLKLSERVYICEECGLEIDRDKNASINLSRYSA